MDIHLYSIFFADAIKQVAADNEFIRSFFSSFCKYLKFPLSQKHFCINACYAKPCIKACIQMFLDDIATGDIAIAYCTIVGSLWARIAFSWKTHGQPILL